MRQRDGFNFGSISLRGPQPDCLSDLVASNRLVEAELSTAAGNPQQTENDQGSGIGRLCTLTVLYAGKMLARDSALTLLNYFTFLEILDAR